MKTKSIFSSIDELEKQLKLFTQLGGYIINPLGSNPIELETGEVVELPVTGRFQLLSGLDKNSKPYGLKQIGVLYQNKEYFVTVPEDYSPAETLKCKVSTYTSKSGSEVKTFKFSPTVTSAVGERIAEATI